MSYICKLDIANKSNIGHRKEHAALSPPSDYRPTSHAAKKAETQPHSQATSPAQGSTGRGFFERRKESLESAKKRAQANVPSTPGKNYS